MGTLGCSGVQVEGEREYWIDFAKGIGIILVVWAHSISREKYIWILINQFHMPLFFMISGYLYNKKKNYGEFIRGKVRSLWLPYVVSSVITILFSLGLGNEGGIIFWIKKIIKVFLLLEPGPLLGATWFLQVLFYAIILYDIITRLIMKFCKEKTETIITIIVSICLFVGILTQLPYHGSVILNTLFFIHLGKLMKSYYHWEKWKLPIFILLICACAVISIFNKASYINNTYTNPLLFVVGAVIGSVGVIGICKRIYRKKYL